MWSTHCVAGRIGSAGAFNEKGCKAELIDGLYQIHRDQGIEVADQVSQKASKPWISPSSPDRTLFSWWVKRKVYCLRLASRCMLKWTITCHSSGGFITTW